MRLGHTIALAGLLVLGQAAQAEDFFPLAEGNYWTYRSTTGDETFTIQVSRTLISANGRIYYPVRGWAAEMKYVRQQESDYLFWDEESGGEGYMAAFTNPGTRYVSMLGACPQIAEMDTRRAAYEGPALKSTGAARIVYESGCPDNSIEEELYVDNVGMVRRTVSTIAGPKTYELVAARVGRMTISAGPAVVSRLMLDRTYFYPTSEPMPMRAELRISMFETGPVRVRFNSSQQYEIVVRNSRHEVVHRYSDGRFFLPAMGEMVIEGERAFAMETMLPGNLPDGEYQVEAWLATSDGPHFAASAGIYVSSVMPAEIE